MTPEEHHARAEKLIADAEKLYASLQRDVSSAVPPDATGWRFLDTTVGLAQAHATLAASPVRPSFAKAVGDGPDGYHSAGIIHYGDDDPTYDR